MSEAMPVAARRAARSTRVCVAPAVTVSRIAAETWALARICPTRVRLCERSGPRAATFWLRNFARSSRAVRRVARSPLTLSRTISRQPMGSPNCTKMSARLKTRMRNRRSREDIAHPSENRDRTQDLSLLAARPQKMDTGTSASVESSRSRSLASRRRIRSDVVRMVWRLLQPAGRFRKKNRLASSKASMDERGDGRPCSRVTRSRRTMSASDRWARA